ALAATEAVGALDPQRAPAALRRALGHPDAEVREVAVRELTKGHSHENPVEEDLATLVDDPHGTVRQTAACCLASLGTDVAVGKLLSIAVDGPPAARAAALEAVCGVDAGAAVDAALYAALDDPSWEVRAAALCGLAARRQVDVTQSLLDRLTDTSAAVRRAAVRVLGRQKPGPWADRLTEVFRHDPDAGVRRGCARAMAQLGVPGATDTLVEYLVGEQTDPHVVVGAIDALAVVGDERAETTLNNLMIDGDPEVREHAAAALESIARRRPVPAG
ncbi:MAG TPA: hypothetical protein EYH34_09900, partial [Planctomycetes bacterium]|nr:hypothetical protein [Planctomycetota bacterium]